MPRSTNAEGTLAQNAYRKILVMILDGQLRPGDVMQPSALVTALSMSPTPIREAIRQMQADGLAESSGRSVQVRRLSEPEVDEIFFMRLSLEPSFAANARVEPTDLDAMEERIFALMRHGPSGVGDSWTLDSDFHQMILLASGNRTAAQVIAKLHRRTAVCDHTMPPARFLKGCAEHLDILEAIRERDSQRAERAMVQHLESARDAMLRRLSREASA